MDEEVTKCVTAIAACLVLLGLIAGVTIYNIRDDVQMTQRVVAACQSSQVTCQSALTNSQH